MKKIAFCLHPLSSELKDKIIRQGFKILDIKFKPKDIKDGNKVFDKVELDKLAKSK